MSKNYPKPTTLAGIKSLAKELHADGLAATHSEALNLASIRAEYQNYQHARNALNSLPNSQGKVKHQTYLTAYWYDFERKQNGYETLCVSLSQPWDVLLTQSQLELSPELWKYTAEDQDQNRLHKQTFIDNTQQDARESVCYAARMLQFIDATGLKPSREISMAYPNGNSENRIPGQDHVSIWLDENDRYLITDEPYVDRLELVNKKRENWITKYRYNEMKSPWRGMHYPDGGTQLNLLSSYENGVPLEPIMLALQQLSAPFSKANWLGESVIDRVLLQHQL